MQTGGKAASNGNDNEGAKMQNACGGDRRETCFGNAPADGVHLAVIQLGYTARPGIAPQGAYCHQDLNWLTTRIDAPGSGELARRGGTRSTR